MSTLDFYQKQAAQCRRDAEAATLHNVRNRNEQAAVAWENMAERLTRTLAHRDANEIAKARASGLGEADE